MEITKNEIKKIIDAGGATLTKNGGAVTFKRGYQVSRRLAACLESLRGEKNDCSGVKK